MENNDIYREIYTSQNKAGDKMGINRKSGHRKARLIKTLFGFYPRMLPVTLVCIVFSA